MEPLGPWDAARRVAVAVSGGADSLALALLCQRWGAPFGLIVDHGLRPGSAGEAAQAQRILAARGMPATVLRLAGLMPGPGLQARARAARYAVLEAAAAAAGAVDLLLGHHAQDQAETIQMRGRQGSGLAGLAGMAAVAEGMLVRRVRPLLGVAPGRLKDTLRAEGVGWAEDPSNADPAFARARLRASGSMQTSGDARAEHAATRIAADHASAAALAANASLFPEGYAVLPPGDTDPASFARLLRAIAGRAYAPPAAAAAALARRMRPATLAGVQVLPAGRLGPGWLLVREAAAMAPPVAVQDGAVWDGRFRFAGAPLPGAVLGALGADAGRFRRRDGLPSAVLRTLPAIRWEGALICVPALGWAADGIDPAAIILRHHAGPACGAAFLA